eukprot:Pompholyxophrys_punicea_v1_NODE_265_length_2478_cov_92.556748.p3 type:complete len:106 gc:universal NODE_265_length_2478_cov_92.556748:554-237(-)
MRTCAITTICFMTLNRAKDVSPISFFFGVCQNLPTIMSVKRSKSMTVTTNDVVDQIWVVNVTFPFFSSLTNLFVLIPVRSLACFRTVKNIKIITCATVLISNIPT